MSTKRLTATEREMIMAFSVAADLIVRTQETMPERTAMIPGGKRDLAMMASKVRKLVERYMDTIPTEQLPIIKRSMASCSYRIGSRRPAEPQQDTKNYGIWLPYEVLNELLEGAREKCVVCTLDKAQRRACKLKKALDTVPNDVREKDDGDCQYYTLI